MSAPAPTYLSITISPPNDDLAMEVWATWEEHSKRMGTFDADGIIGYLYRIADPDTPSPPVWVWLNDHGHPTKTFFTDSSLQTWLDQQSITPVKWGTEPVV